MPWQNDLYENKFYTVLKEQIIDVEYLSMLHTSEHLALITSFIDEEAENNFLKCTKGIENERGMHL